MRTLLIALVAMILPACASVFDEPFNPEFDRGPDVKINYVYVDHEWELLTLCNTDEVELHGKQLLGCALVPPVPDGVCVVILYRNNIWRVKGHEEKHCRYGRWHS